MATTLEDLERRVIALEQQMADLRPRVDETPAERVARFFREVRAQQPAISAAVAKAFAEMGITGEPVGHEKLRQMMLECGVNPEDDAFSREIIAMREE